MPSSWFTPIDNYCERIDPGFWAEPLNAWTNGAFILAALYAFAKWGRNGVGDWASLWLIVVTVIVGIGSFLFHTFANRWSLLADVLPIAVFIYSYFLLAMRRYLYFSPVVALTATVLFVAFNMSFPRLWFSLFPGVTLNGSVGYIPAALAMVTVGIGCLLVKMQRAGRALLLGTFVFALSLLFRTMDHAICSTMPVGTHFLWHILNALVLGILMNAAISNSSLVRPSHAEG